MERAMEAPYDLQALRNGYKCNERAAAVLRRSGLVVVGNELAGSGKDYLMRSIVGLPGSNFGFVPSRKTRDKRPGEVLGVDFVRSPLPKAVEEVKKGNYIEWEPLRGTEINGTHMAELLNAIRLGIRPIKDAEPSGQVNLRNISPDLRAVYPMPDLANWLNMLKDRENLPGETLASFVAGDFRLEDLPDIEHSQNWFDYNKDLAKKRGDIIKRMEVARDQWEVVWRLGLHNDPNTLFLVNPFGGIGHTAYLAESFFNHGRHLPHITSPQCMSGEQVLDYLGQASDLAGEVLAAA